MGIDWRMAWSVCIGIGLAGLIDNVAKLLIVLFKVWVTHV